MTEKRFTVDSEENGLCKCILMNGEEIPTCEVVELLNELCEENNAVKDIINELNSMDFYRDSALLDEYLGKIARILGCDWE